MKLKQDVQHLQILPQKLSNLIKTPEDGAYYLAHAVINRAIADGHRNYRQTEAAQLWDSIIYFYELNHYRANQSLDTSFQACSRGGK